VASNATTPNQSSLRGELVLSLSVNLANIMSLGKLYPWPRPERCPRCGSHRLWGHGYVSRYFDGTPDFLWMKRWRCPECGAVHTCRPDSHWRRFLAPIATIFASLIGKLAEIPWQKDDSRQRQQYWYRGYLMQSQFDGLPHATIESLSEDGIVIATHSTTDRATIPWPGRLHPSFAATGPP
jgi:hypothetical protein